MNAVGMCSSRSEKAQRQRRKRERGSKELEVIVVGGKTVVVQMFESKWRTPTRRAYLNGMTEGGEKT